MNRLALRTRFTAVLPWLVLCGLLASAESLAESKVDTDRIGWFGLSRDVRLDAKFGQATRNIRGGHVFEGRHGHVQIEAGKFVKASRLGNLAGIEAWMGLGYTQASGDTPGQSGNNIEGVREVIPVMFDMGVGFPVTLLHFGGEGGERFMLGISPGMGLNFLHGYLQIKAKAAARLTSDVTAEAQWQWVPGTVSLPTADRQINTATLRGSVYWGKPGDGAWMAFAEYTRSQWEIADQATPNAAWFGGQNPYTSIRRGDFETSFSVGGGWAF